MTPKEKAKELVDKFEPLTRQFDSDEGWIINLQDAKQCAIIAVDEIVKEIYKYNHSMTWELNNYWQSVKEEIEKL